MFNMYADVCRTYTLESVRPYVVRCIDVREEASGASADAPGVGLEMVSGLKLLQKDEKI